MKNLSRSLFTLIMIIALMASLAVSASAAGGYVDTSADTSEAAAISEEADTVTEEADTVTAEAALSAETTDTATEAMEDNTSNSAANASGYTTPSTVPTITLQAGNYTLKTGEVFGTVYSNTVSYNGNTYVVSYTYKIMDKNGNEVSGEDVGSYVLGFKDIQVYAPDDLSNPLPSSDYYVSTYNGTLTRVKGTTTSSSTSSSTGTTSSTTSVKTGDENNIGLWVALSVVALAGVTTSVVLVRRKASK